MLGNVLGLFLILLFVECFLTDESFELVFKRFPAVSRMVAREHHAVLESVFRYKIFR